MRCLDLDYAVYKEMGEIPYTNRLQPSFQCLYPPFLRVLNCGTAKGRNKLRIMYTGLFWKKFFWSKINSKTALKQSWTGIYALIQGKVLYLDVDGTLQGNNCYPIPAIIIFHTDTKIRLYSLKILFDLLRNSITIYPITMYWLLWNRWKHHAKRLNCNG